MEISYRREIKHNYLAVMPEAGWDAGYEARMLAGNEIQGLLRMHIRYQDGSPVYYYDITSRQPLNRLLETRFISRDEICQILIQIHVALTRMEEFLLSDRGILLEPEFVYMEPEFFKVGLCLIPGRNGSFPESLSSFLQYILKCINHKDRECVVLAYGMYQESLKVNYGLEDILKFVSPERNRDKGTGTEPPKSSKAGENVYRAPEDIDKDTDPDADDSPVEEGYVKTERGGRKESAASDCEVRLPVGKQAAGWMTAVILLPAALWLFRGKQAVLDLRMAFLIMDGGLFLALALADIVMWKMKRGKNGGPQERHMNDGGGFAPGPPDSPWRILYEDEETEQMEEPVREDMKAEGIRKETPAEKEETFQTTLLTERPADEDVHRLTPMNAAGEEILIPYYPFVIGKHKDLADYVLAKDTVSRFHLRIDRGGDGFTVTDLNSTNGTRIKGRVLDSNETAVINVGDEIYIADLGYIFL